MGFIVSAIWLHLITPVETTVLVAGYGLCTQGYGVWKLRRSLDWRALSPFLIGGAIGVPLGALLLTQIDARYLRSGVGLLLIAYGLYGLTQPAFKAVPANSAANGGIGFANGVLCGITGLPGFVITVWCQMRGWSKDAQRAVFQPVMLAAIVMTALSLTAAGAVTASTLKLYFVGLPAMLGGLWLGFRLYGKLDDALFRKAVLTLLLAAGIALTAAHGLPMLRSEGG
jgi:uncharacterized membrane protein YfcA